MTPDKIAHLLRLVAAPRPRILDVGAAYYGQRPIYQTLWEVGGCELILIDADKEHIEQLKTLYPRDATIINQAVGPAGEATLYVCPAGMTSLLKPKADALAFFNGFTEFGNISSTEKITLTPLDSLKLGEIDFLKIDVQGSEKSVMESGKTCLSSLVGTQLELSFIALYENQPTQGEMDVFLRGLGMAPHCLAEFKRWSIAPIVKNNNIMDPFNQLLEADFVYFKDPLNVRAYTNDQLAKALILSLALYDSLDLGVYYAMEMAKRGRSESLPQDILNLFLAA